MGLPVLIMVIPLVCYLLWLFVKLRRLSRLQNSLRRRAMARGMSGPPSPRRRRRHHRKE
ncbi:hypothetical protein HMPREF0201_04694 [Cedecea davisae DSM 4568]|uniref:High mobility group protein Z n=1 Tax=Cedecea davisae DSM 4568 TaxID=566551 RepID=S3JHE4_9ENTR|nr:hypothetical protein HMPREF0201_04694 [Cedecea davisae DSM 4568]